MLKKILEWFGFRDPRCFGCKRSSRWATVRKHYLENHPGCAATGSLDDVEVHHKVPVHVDASKELDEDNLISLRRDVHLLLGHLDDWSSYNKEVAVDAAEYMKKKDRRP